MTKKEEEFKKRLLETFRIEAGDHLKAISSGLIKLEKTGNQDERRKSTENIYREAHSLKGASRSVNIRSFESICNTLENVLGRWKREEITPSRDMFDKMHTLVDFMSEKLGDPRPGEIVLENHVSEILSQSYETDSGTEDISGPGSGKGLTEKESSDQSGKKVNQPSEKEQPPAGEGRILEGTVRISRMKLDSLMMQTEEMLSVKLKLYQRFTELQDLGSVLSQLKKEIMEMIRENPKVFQIQVNETKNPDRENNKINPGQSEKYDKSSELVELMEAKLSVLVKSAGEDHRMAGRMIDNMLEEMRNILMLPISSILELFPGLVRNLSREQGKNVELEMQGAENEVDRRVLEEIKDPLIHLVRNCIDHGIEKPEERIKNGKPSSGKITIKVSQLPGNKVEILVSDDGEGIDLAGIKKAAIKNELVSEKDDLTDDKLETLVYHSGITTSPILTDLSGRGLGLAIVKEKVESLGGTVSVRSQHLKGTAFTMQIPLTLATYRGIFIEVDGAVFVVPAANVERILRINRSDIKMVENRETVSMNGNTLSYVNLGDILETAGSNREEPEVKDKTPNRDVQNILIMGAGNNRIAFGIDRIINEQEILVKHLSKPLARVRNTGGVTILGSGRVVPILNISDIMKSAVTGPSVSTGSASEKKAEEKQRSALVAEDSITSRMLLRDILESAGFFVKTAVDGAEALSLLREGEFDILVSDIDMPRMNGFELTLKVRADKKLGELPVVLVTALKSREDREHGMEVGANAYIEKGSFDPQQLLEVINRLV